MAYEEEQARRSRVVVDTPTSRREVVHSESYRSPEGQGVTGAMLAVIVIGAIALATVIILFAMNQQQQDKANTNTGSQTAPPQTIVQQPAQQPPVIVQQPAPATQPAPVIINQPPTAAGGAANAAPDDSTIQSAIDKKLSNDPVFSTMGITATVMGGKVMLTGTVKSEAQKSQVERLVRSVKGVKSVDNQIVD